MAGRSVNEQAAVLRSKYSTVYNRQSNLLRRYYPDSRLLLAQKDSLKMMFRNGSSNNRSRTPSRPTDDTRYRREAQEYLRFDAACRHSVLNRHDDDTRLEGLIAPERCGESPLVRSSPVSSSQPGIKAEIKPHEKSRAVPDLYPKIIMWKGLRGTRAMYSLAAIVIAAREFWSGR